MCFFRRKAEREALAKKLEVKNVYNNLIAYMAQASVEYGEKEDQARLDFQKWIESEKSLTDRSGKMEYCPCCPFRKDEQCTVGQDERVAGRLCSKACKAYIMEVQHQAAMNFTFRDNN